MQRKQMSTECKLFQQDDWLEYPSGSSTMNKLLLVAIFAVGIFLFGFEVWLENQLSKCVLGSTTKTMLRALQVISVIMVAVPGALLVMNYVTTSRQTNRDLQFPAAILLALLGAALVIVCIALQNSLPSECSNVWPNWIWIPVGGIAAVAALLLVYRYKNRGIAAPAKAEIDWTNPAVARDKIEEIGQKQGLQCNYNVTSEEAISAFANYLESRRGKPIEIKQQTNNSWLPWNNRETISYQPGQIKLPIGVNQKYPNILKMANQQKKASTNAAKGWNVATTLQPVTTQPTQPTQPVAIINVPQSTLDTLVKAQ